MKQRNYTFFNTTEQFKQALKETFGTDYTNEEIISALYDLEVKVIEEEWAKENEPIEFPEDFDLN